MTLDNKKLLAIAALCVGLTQIGHFLKGASWLVQSPAIAYAAKATADKVDEQFDRYLEQQQKVAEALNQYVASQQQQQQTVYANQAAPIQEGIRVWDKEQNLWWCCPYTDTRKCWDEEAWEICE